MPDTILPLSPELVNAIQAAQPNWVKDGFGIRGNPIPSFSGGSPGWGGDSTGGGGVSPRANDPQQVDFGGSISSPAEVPSAASGQQSPPPKGPFQIVLQTITSGGSPTLQAGVAYKSLLLLSADPSDDYTITGLLGSVNPDTSDAGWFNVADGDYVWLEIGVGGSAVSSASIKHGSTIPGAVWTTGGCFEKDAATPPSQTFARKVLGQIHSNSTGSSVDQWCSTNAMMQNMCINGSPAIYPGSY